jgi:hypothetical protein
MPMSTWEETKQHLRERFKIAVEEASWIGLTWVFHEGADQEFQRQRIELVQALGQTHLLIMSDVVAEEALQPRDLLRHNSTLAIGALATFEGLYVMRHVIPMANLTWDILDTALEFMAHEAARLRRQSRATPAFS